MKNQKILFASLLTVFVCAIHTVNALAIKTCVIGKQDGVQTLVDMEAYQGLNGSRKKLIGL